jgi:hypothetical protein
MPDKHWYTITHPTKDLFPDTHLLAYFEANTITYKEPTIPPKLHKPKLESKTLHIYCIHYQSDTICSPDQLQPLSSTLNIPNFQLHFIGPTPLNTPVNTNPKWHSLPSCPLQLQGHLPPPLSHYTSITVLKVLPQYSYYTDGSFIPPKLKNNDQWQRETTGYGIYNSTKNINISEHLPGLQNILRAEFTAIHHTIQLINRQFPTKPAHIFTDNLNSLYLLNTQITHPTHHNNHPDKVILASIVHMLQNRTHPLSIHKV